MRSAWVLLAALGLPCGSAGDTDGSGTGTGGDESPTSAETSAQSPTYPDCAGICFEEAIAGGSVTEIWHDEAYYNVDYTVRGDPSLVAIEDHDDVVTLHRIAWPGL